MNYYIIGWKPAQCRLRILRVVNRETRRHWSTVWQTCRWTETIEAVGEQYLTIMLRLLTRKIYTRSRAIGSSAWSFSPTYRVAIKVIPLCAIAHMFEMPKSLKQKLFEK